MSFALKSDPCGLAEELLEVGLGPKGEGGLTTATERVREKSLDAEPMSEFLERGIELALEDQSGNGEGPGSAGLPHDMELNVAVVGVDVVAMSVPCGGVQVDFDVARSGKILAELNEGVAKIGAGFVVPKARVKNSERLTVQRDEFVSAEALVQPECLQETF